MQNNFSLTNNGINTLLNLSEINIPVNIDMYFQLVDYKILQQQYNLYQCTMKDDVNTYDRFILKSSKPLIINNIFHIKTIRITISEEKRYINCLIYENMKINDYLKRLNNLKLIEEQKEKEKKEKEELKRKELEEESKKKKIEEEKDLFLNEELNLGTALLITNLKHEEKKPRYNFKWDKGNLKFFDLSKNNIIEEEKENQLDLNSSSEKKNLNKIKEEDKKNEIIEKEEKEKEDLNKMDIEKNENKNIKDKEKEEKEEKEEEKEEENEYKKEIEEIFNSINLEDLFKINKKKQQSQGKKLKQDFELIINLSMTNYSKPIYVKCIQKMILTNTKNNRIVKCLLTILRDSDGAEITAYTYGEKVIERIDKIISLGGVYIISKYKVTPLYFTSAINCNYRLVLTIYTKIEPMPPDSVFNNIHFHFLTIEDLFFFKEGCVVDICGIIYDEGEPRIYNMKNGQKYMRNVLIADTTKKKLNITLYEPHSKDDRIKLEKGEIIALKYGRIGMAATRVKKINTTNYSIIRNSTGDYQHDCLLKNFYEENKNIDNFLFIHIKEEYKYLKDILSQMEYNTEHNVPQSKFSFVTKAYVDNFCIDEDSLYKACPICSKKVLETKENKYECILCNKTFNKPKYMFKLTLRVKDTNAKAYFRLIGIKANKVLEVEPEVVRQYLDEGRHKDLENIEKKVLFNEYIFTVTLTSFINNRTGKILHNMNIDSMEKADGENLKRIFELIQDENE